MTGEVWKVVPSAPWFLVSSEGRVMVAPYEAEMPNGGKRQYGGQPHFGVWSRRDARFIIIHKGKTYKVAQLVCEAFNGVKPFPHAVCMHLDENSANNRPNNLGWGTQKQNLNAPNYLRRLRQRPLQATCAECSATFEPKYLGQKYCNRECSHANNAAHSAARLTKNTSEWR